MASALSLFSITSISGMNNSDPSITLPEDQCVDAQNVEFYTNALGERRLGCDGVDVPVAFSGDANIQAITWLHRHIPSANSETDTELWALGQHLTSTNFSLQRKTTVWATVTPDVNIEVINNQGFKLSGVSFHGKLFLAYPNTSAVDRLFVWDGATLRRSGLTEPAAPTLGNTGAGTLSGKRYYRVRYIEVTGSTVLRRSEPSDSTSITPSGAGASVRVTKPAAISEGESHWEIEASLDNVNFYRISRAPVGTTTYDDSTAYATGYNTVANVLSADTGDYSLLHCPRFVIVDEDRLVLAGAWEDSTRASRILWTPRFGDTTGDGNDERWELDTDPFLDLDNYNGGPITAISTAVDGQIWVFKSNKTYVLSRTGNREKAYRAYKVSDTVGALEGSVVQGVDQFGQPCLYFIDQRLGPQRTGGNKTVQSCGKDTLTTWETLNTDAVVITRSLFYPKKQQVLWWIATDANTSPNLVGVLHTTNTEEKQDGIRGGWAQWTGKLAEGYSACLYADNINANTTRSLDLVPFVGTTSANGYILISDTGLNDDGEAFSARILSKPYILRSLLAKFKVMAASVLGVANTLAQLTVTIVRDFGLQEPKTVDIAFAATASETDVIKQMHNLGTQFHAVQVEFSDVASPLGTWELNRFDMKISPEETA